MRPAIVFLAAALATVSCTQPKTVKAAALKPEKDRKMAPDFALKDENSKTVKLSEYRGKVVLLDFWATWCGPCKIEIPWFIEFERKLKDKGFAVVGVSMDEDGFKVVTPFARELGINYRIVIGDDMTAQLYGGVEALPTTFLIDRDGRIANVHVGLASKGDIENGIQQLLQAQRVSRLPSLDLAAFALGAK